MIPFRIETPDGDATVTRVWLEHTINGETDWTEYESVQEARDNLTAGGIILLEIARVKL